MGIEVTPDDDDNDEPTSGGIPPLPPAPEPAGMPAPVAGPDAPGATTPPPAAPDLQAELAAKDDQIAKLSAAVHRNNTENARRRTIAKFMKENNITDLDELQARLGIVPAPVGSPDPVPPATVETDDLKTELVEHRTRAEEAETRATAQETRATTLETALRERAIDETLRRARFAGDPQKARRVMDLTKVTVSETGEVAGVEEAVKALRDEIPEWFNAPQRRTAPPANRVDAGERRPAPARPPTWDQQVSQRIRGGR